MNKRSNKKSNKAKLTPAYQSYRESMGYHTRWQDERLGRQQNQDAHVQRLARHPGLHSGNAGRQNATLAMVQLLAMISSLQMSSSRLTPSARANQTSSAYYTYQQARANRTHSQNEGSALSVNLHRDISAIPSMPAPLPLNVRVPNQLSFPKQQPSLPAFSKRSISLAENIPYEIFTMMNDQHFDYQLRNAFDMIFRKAQKALEVREAHKEDKNLYLLLKCIQGMQLFIIQNNNLRQGREMLHSLIEIANTLDNPRQKELIDKFKTKFLLENASISMTNSSMNNLLLEKNLTNGLIVLSHEERFRIILKEQNRRVDRLLEKNQFTYHKSQSLNRINKLVHYLLAGDTEDQQHALAKALLQPLEEDMQMGEGYKMALIVAYFNHEILGMSLDKWLVKQMQLQGLSKQVVFTQRHLELWLNNILNRWSRQGQLSLEARTYYRDQVLKKLLPTITLQLSQDGQRELSSMNITEPRWGFIHAGAQLLNDSGAMLTGLELIDIEDVGMTINSMLREGTLPHEYIGYFTLPALLFYAKNIYIPDLEMINEQEMQEIFQRYFAYIGYWEKNNNPLIRLNALGASWKTRTDLAKELLHRRGISDEWMSFYLNSHQEVHFGAGKLTSSGLLDGNPFKEIKALVPKVSLPNVDEVFNTQNILLANTAFEVDQLSLAQVFNELSETEQDFIAQAKIDRVRIQFNARDSINKVPLSQASRRGLIQSGALIYNIPDHIDLLACTLKGKERIYALKSSKESGKYMLNWVDRDREALLWLLEDSSVPKADPDYKIRVTSHFTLKEAGDPPQKLIEKLAEFHKNKLFKGLIDKGYDKTTQEKVGEFFLSLIPFYTCIAEGIKGNEQEAIPACIMDILSMVPFAGKAVQTGMRFSNVLEKSTAAALRYGARQVTLKSMLKQTGKELINHAPLVAEEISPQVIRGLSREFLRNIDPGFELLSSGGAKGIRTIENMLSRINNRSPGITKLSEALKKSYLFSLPKKVKAPSLANKNQLDIKGGAQQGGSKNNAPDTLIKKNQIENISVWPHPFKEVAKRHISGSHYIQYYTKSKKNKKNSEILVLSAHGGFSQGDCFKPVVILPSDITLKMLTPHATILRDPGLEHVVNAGKNLKAFVTISNGKVTNVNFLPQKNNPEWRFSKYDPSDNFNTLGAHGGMQNYRHLRYETESDELITHVLLKNRRLAKKGKAILTDILTVDNDITKVSESSLEKASVQKILDLDREGKLLNERGEHYKTVVFSHCRTNFAMPSKFKSTYVMRPAQLNSFDNKGVPKDYILSEVTLTHLNRDDLSKEFNVNNYVVGLFLFAPVELNIQSNQSSSRPL